MATFLPFSTVALVIFKSPICVAAERVMKMRGERAQTNEESTGLGEIGLTWEWKLASV